MVKNSDSGYYLRVPCACAGANENCYRCGGWGYIDRIGNSLGEGIEKPRSSPAKKPKLRRSCPYCGESVVRMARHIKKHHPKDANSPFTATSTLPTNPKTLGACPVCNILVRNDRLQRHVKKAHSTMGGRPIDKPAAKVTPGNVALSQISAPLPTRNVGVALEKPLDGTLDYHSVFRENGRFGSHPSFDRYDDESGA